MAVDNLMYCMVLTKTIEFRSGGDASGFEVVCSSEIWKGIRNLIITLRFPVLRSWQVVGRRGGEISNSFLETSKKALCYVFVPRMRDGFMTW